MNICLAAMYASDLAKKFKLLFYPHFAIYKVLMCMMHAHILGPNFQEKLLIQLFIYLYL